ncbi:MAG: hypothetical protein C7B45_16105 [Sulfobacillus acidophilus]|uniref:YgjP-like metallopeptidase domain-containing protein n=1 Tax=Sulfobacillus acidophilus TaxID=53633 RepID=A0A2T2WD61_9FIRM|nr:MAG: hypothetical protein C7B45_16105 [Sulfobacillus acidophilus]
MPTIELESMTVAYSVEERPRRRYPAIRVDGQRCVTVLVPTGYSALAIPTLLLQHKRWLLGQLARPGVPLKGFQTGEIFTYLGLPVSLWLTAQASRAAVHLTDDRRLAVQVTSGCGDDQARMVRAALTGWFCDRAQDVLPPRVAHYSQALKAYPNELKIREYKSRWGFCRTDGLIALNWRLIQAPLAVIDYVVVHELIHRTYPHHQPTFWAAVKRARPSMDSEREWLKTHGQELFW